MNFLAHFALAPEEEGWIVGNFLTDFLRKKNEAELSKEIREGVFIHRQIDWFTDNHPVVDECILKLHSTQGKYASVIVDILFDYILATNWDRYNEVPLLEFSNKINRILIKNIQNIPPKVQPVTQRMTAANWLTSYEKESGMRYAFTKLKERTKFDNQLHTAFDDFRQYESFFTEAFHEFYPELYEKIQSVKTTLRSERKS